MACQSQSIRVGSEERTAIICAPPVAAGALPLLLVFHGRGGSAAQIARSTRLHEVWPEAVVVYLQGLTGNPGPNDPKGRRAGWQLHPGEKGDRDVDFSTTLIDTVASRYKIDPRRVYATGHSNGARFVAVLWALQGQRFAALAFSAAQADGLIEAANPLSVFMAMGVNDEVVSFDWQRRSIGYAVKRFGLGQIDGEHVGARSVRNADGVELMVFIHDKGHAWPAEQSLMMVEFFKRQNKRPGGR